MVGAVPVVTLPFSIAELTVTAEAASVVAVGAAGTVKDCAGNP